MRLFKELTSKYPEIGKIVIDTDIFGIERSIKIVYKDGEISTHKGSDIKDFNLYIDMCNDSDKNSIIKKVSYLSDTISRIEVYERDGNYYPTRYKIYLDDGRTMIYNSLISFINNSVKRDSNGLDKYIIESLLKRYGINKEELDKYLNIDPVSTNINDENNPINRFIKSHTSIKNKRIREDSRIISSEDYKRIDIISCNEFNFPSTMVIYYNSGRSITVKDEYTCNKFLRSALSRGIDTCNYYPESSKSKVEKLTVYTNKFDEKMSIKKRNIDKLFAIFSKDKKYKK